MSRKWLLGVVVAAILVGSLCVASKAVQAAWCSRCNKTVTLASKGAGCAYAAVTGYEANGTPKYEVRGGLLTGDVTYSTCGSSWSGSCSNKTKTISGGCQTWGYMPDPNGTVMVGGILCKLVVTGSGMSVYTVSGC